MELLIWERGSHNWSGSSRTREELTVACCCGKSRVKKVKLQGVQTGFLGTTHPEQFPSLHGSCVPFWKSFPVHGGNREESGKCQTRRKVVKWFKMDVTENFKYLRRRGGETMEISSPGGVMSSSCGIEAWTILHQWGTGREGGASVRGCI